jgi:hypothetical protein
MKTNPDPNRDDPLLDAILGDESWQAASAAMKARATESLVARRLHRRLMRWVVGVVAVSAVALVAVLRPNRTGSVAEPVVPVSRDVPEMAVGLHYMTDEQLLACFPAGSCMLVEVDGQKELVFLDPASEHKYLSRTEQPVN